LHFVHGELNETLNDCLLICSEVFSPVIFTSLNNVLNNTVNLLVKAWTDVVSLTSCNHSKSIGQNTHVSLCHFLTAVDISGNSTLGNQSAHSLQLLWCNTNIDESLLQVYNDTIKLFLTLDAAESHFEIINNVFSLFPECSVCNYWSSICMLFIKVFLGYSTNGFF
jgi:hypothetical protein